MTAKKKCLWLCFITDCCCQLIILFHLTQIQAGKLTFANWLRLQSSRWLLNMLPGIIRSTKKQCQKTKINYYNWIWLLLYEDLKSQVNAFCTWRAKPCLANSVTHKAGGWGGGGLCVQFDIWLWALEFNYVVVIQPDDSHLISYKFPVIPSKEQYL